ncbi:cold shock domain-containing protein [Ferrimonas sp. SCSIO 43195]|uniref:cold shock domain-containing protein n=1 Tax=Ferrimonas sp. SCSIO 43195 TaxID=2822844 RepID=UPI0020757874|nr:cold shock domain-containing protein [Ferrimonas sp. SCSIO 43195]USD36564.1 cold shock domain-containing protein [Ferrimonas sp. SCSIO 43195]
MRQQGLLVRWNDNKGYGFVEPDKGGPAVFAHISEFRQQRIRPQIGDRLTFDLETGGPKGPRAIRIEAELEPGFRPESRHRFALWSPAFLVLALVSVGSAVWTADKFIVPRLTPAPSEQSAPTEPEAQPQSLPSPEAATDTFRCEGKQHCSQMNSCAEATFYLNHCPNQLTDGDGDGVPCESQWCN